MAAQSALSGPVSGGSRNEIVLDLARKTAGLAVSGGAVNAKICGEIRQAVNSLPLSFAASSRKKPAQWDDLGCKIWNAAATLAAGDPGENRSPAGNAALIRVFAFFLIDAGYSSQPKQSKDSDRNQLIRAITTALKACRFCLAGEDTAMALKVLERCADHVNTAEASSPPERMVGSNANAAIEASLKALVVEFHTLRIAHAWKTERLDLAEYAFKQIDAADLAESSSVSEKAAVLFVDIGRSLHKRHDDRAAIQWLERAMTALDILIMQPLRLSNEVYSELRVMLVTTYVECSVRAGEAEYSRRAWELVRHLKSTHDLGDLLSVRLLHVALILKQQPVNDGQLKDKMLTTIRSAVLTDKSFKIIMRYIHLTGRVNREVACCALEELVSVHLLQTSNENHQLYLDRACVTYVLFITRGLFGQDNLEKLRRTFDAIVQHLCGLSPKATHAAQTLMWQWARQGHSPALLALLQHSLFDNAGQVNKAKIGRRAMAVAVASNDMNAARAAFFQMLPTIQNESKTRYLAFKLALRMKDYNFAKESLGIVVKNTSSDDNILYACALEAQRSEMRNIAVAALQAIVEKQPANTHLPALLRCTARLLVGELSINERASHQRMEEVVRVFENAADNMQIFQHGRPEQRRAEIQWWSKNAYNLALKHCTETEAKSLLRLLAVCSKFLAAGLSEAGDPPEDDLVRRRALCHYLSVCALITSARPPEDDNERSDRSPDDERERCFEYFRLARIEIERFREIWRACSQYDQECLHNKAFELSKYDLECILRLKKWDDLDAALQACLNFAHIEHWDTLADIILIIRREADINGFGEPTKARTNEVLEKIINETWQKDKDVGKASRWLRLSFSMDLKEDSGEFSLQLLQQAVGIAKKCAGSRDGAYPETELHWLAATAFNRAIEITSKAGTMDASEAWFKGAMELSRYATDKGALYADLTEKHRQVACRVSGSCGVKR